MARTMTEKERAAAEITGRLEATPVEWRDAKPLKRIADAFTKSVAAEQALAEAVSDARDAGFSWAAIAAMLGVSKQTAQKRFG